MNISSAAFFLNFFNNYDLFILVMVRMVAFFMLLPVFSGQYVNNIVRIGFPLALSVMAVSSGNVFVTGYGDNIFSFVSMMLGEFAVGIIMAFVVYTVFSICLLAGQLMDYQIGFSMVSVFDPVSQIQVPVTGNFYYLVITVMFVQFGGLNYFIQTLFTSYDVIPIGDAFVIGNSGLVGHIIKLLSDFFVIGVQISLPVVGTVLLVDIALGLLVKAVPQMNIFVVGMPIKLLIGLVVLLAVSALFGEYYYKILVTTVEYTNKIIQSLRGLMN